MPEATSGEAAPPAERPAIYVTRPLPADLEARLAAACEVTRWPHETPTERGALLAGVAGKAGVLTLLNDRVDREFFEAAGPGLRIVSNCAVGFDNVDVAEATRRGVLVGNTPGVLTETTADLTFALLLGAARRIVEGADVVRAGRWGPWGLSYMVGRDVHGATLGIVGMGRIGLAVARRAQGFGMDIRYFEPGGRVVAAATALGARPVATLGELLAAADFVTLHVPLTPETHHLIDAAALARMKPTAILVNTARGPVVDMAALHGALVAGIIAAAALDVTDPEPLPADHPLVGLKNCLIVPHIGSASVATRHRMAELAVANLLAALAGRRPPHLVNPAAWPGPAA